MEFKDYYKTLGVNKSSSEKEIKQAYRKLARKYHPDVNPGDKQAEQRFKEINEAYEVLGDPAKRRKYDELGANWRAYEQQAAHGAPGGWPGAGGATYRTVTPEAMQDILGGDPFSDFFQTFFGGDGPARERAGRGRGTRSKRGADVEAVQTLVEVLVVDRGAARLKGIAVEPATLDRRKWRTEEFR